MEVTVGGGRVFCHTGGTSLDVSRPAVVLIHGVGQDHSLFRFQTRWLAHHGVAALAPDLPGHGQSEGPALDTIGGMSSWLLSLLDVVAIRATTVLGHSMGSLVAIETAAVAPEVVEQIVITGPSAAMTVHPDLQAAADATDPLAVELINGWTHSGDDRFGGHPQPGSWSAGVTRRLDERELGRSLGIDLRACSSYPAGERAKEVSCPAIVVVATGDRMTPGASGRELAASIPQSRLVEVPGAGHSILFDRPRIVNRLLAECLDVIHP